MSDLPNSLVEQLQGGAEVVYLPPNARPLPQRGQSSSEATASRPDVAAIARQYFESDDRLHGDRVSEITLAREKPIHRMMAYLHASGATAEDIAEQTGYSVGAVRQILRQPFCKQRVLEILKEVGKDRVAFFLKHEVAPSLETLREIRDSGAAPAARINAANNILDRALGKPTVHVESDNTNRNVPADMARLDSELASLRKQLGETAPSPGAS